jgi:hypothetical protein
MELWKEELLFPLPGWERVGERVTAKRPFLAFLFPIRIRIDEKKIPAF